MGNADITYTAENMDLIISNYKNCAMCTSEIMANLKKTKLNLAENYTGQASDTVADLCSKINEHLDFLSECFTQTANYVTYSQEFMINVDNFTSRRLGGEIHHEIEINVMDKLF